MLFPFEDAFNGWRLISDDNIARRLTSDDKTQVAGVLDFVTGSNSITDIKISKHESDRTDQLLYKKQKLMPV